MDEHCRITVVGERRQVDLAVPAGAPIISYVDTLASLCDQNEADVMPAAWTLAPATGSPFAPEWSLSELGVVDGEILYLRDTVGHESAEPVVHDVAERVTDAVAGALERAWDARARTFTLLGLGLGWIVIALLVFAWRDQVDREALADLALLCGSVLPGLAWVAMERGWPVPPPLRMTLGLSAVPTLGLAAWALSQSPGLGGLGLSSSMTPGGLAATAITAGTLFGAFVAFIASPGVTTTAVLFGAALTAVLGTGLAVLRADTVETAAAAAIVIFALLTVIPSLVSRTVGFASRRIGMRAIEQDTDEDDVVGAVRAATRLLVTWSALLCLAFTTSVVVMAFSYSWCANAEAALLGFAFLLRAGSARLVAEVVPLLVAGAIALLSSLLFAPAHLGWGVWVAPLYALLLGAAMIVYGFRRLMRRPGVRSMERPRWTTAFGSFLAGGGVALAVATFGAFGSLVSLGHHM
ncbi:EsaB/YukD family protein [Streptomyces sp. PTM05]|uniref:EsaB/YukD family protein n=1 Tax=Streptantibioticus parmotrematis TaxID=2873249 RepID=A0ABS7QVM9_9ACTN|nr:EsaB/YukD family protein [Streptantibioticus parmotrematis]MBY8886968.1 EsaB/YukD family protein [Streptantibioticus parmotrematis]